MTLDYTTCLKEAVRANKIPRQKVVNIKLRDNQFIPNTTTNKENLSYNAANLLQKITQGGCSTSRNMTMN